MIVGNSNNSNTSEGALPGAYRIAEIRLTNSYGKEFDIKGLVTKVTIVESIYTYALTASIDIRDTVNLFEELRISGQETVTLVIHKRENGSRDNTKITKKFYVTEIPLYGKVKDAVQAYTLSCVSEHAFVNNLVSISRAMSGSISKNISKIVSGDLQYTGIIENTASSKGNVKLIVPNMKPFTAIGWLLRHAYTELGTPIYAYERFDNTFIIKSHSDICNETSIGTYKFTFSQEKDAYTKEGSLENKFKILSMASDMNSSKYIHSGRGAYASTTKVLDYATKKYYDVKFDYSSKFSQTNTIGTKAAKPLISDKFVIKDETLNHHHDSLYIYLNENSLAYTGYTNYHASSVQSIGAHQSILENIDTIKQNITLNGDLNINPGKKITIEAPKSVDPQVYKKIDDKDAKKSTKTDMMVSGDYMITSVIHNFDTEYTCDLQLKRDFSNYTLNSAD